jgi:putative transposase
VRGEVDAKWVCFAESGPLTMTDVLWERTKMILAVIAPMAARVIVGRAAVDAAELPLSR